MATMENTMASIMVNTIVNIARWSELVYSVFYSIKGAVAIVS